MERELVLVEDLDGELLVGPGDGAERRAAELHTPADDARAVLADDPVRGGRGELLRGGRGGVEQGDLVEAPAQLGVGRREEAVERAEVLDVRVREGGVGLEALEEDDWVVR